MNIKAVLKWQRRMREDPCRSQTQQHRGGNAPFYTLRPMRHKSTQRPPQRQQHYREHNGEANQTGNEGEKKAFRSVMTEFKWWRDNTGNRVEDGGN